MGNSENIPDAVAAAEAAGHQPVEDRALKLAAQFMGEELLPLLGIEGTMKRLAPTEQIYLRMRDFLEDINYEMVDGTWRHLEFESDQITEDDLRRFRTYEAFISYQYKVEVTTCVVCSSSVKILRSELVQGINTYRVQIIRLKDGDADKLIRSMEEKQGREPLEHRDMVSLLLAPLMGGGMPQPERIMRGVKLLQNEREHVKRTDLVRMQSVLYALAMKFLTPKELRSVKEILDMTILGEMLMQDGIERGRKETLDRVNRLNTTLAKCDRMEDILKGAEDMEYQQKLFEEFNL